MEIGHTGAAQEDRFAAVLGDRPRDLGTQELARARTRLFEGQHRELGGSDLPAMVREPVFADEMLERRDRPAECRDDREAAGDERSHVHRGLGDADHGRTRELAGGFEARIVEAGDDVAVEALRLGLADLLQEPRHAEGLVVPALDRDRPHCR